MKAQIDADRAAAAAAAAAGNATADADSESGVGKTDPDWLAVLNKDFYGMGVLNVVSNSELKWTWYKSADGSVLDTVTIQKKH